MNHQINRNILDLEINVDYLKNLFHHTVIFAKK